MRRMLVVDDEQDICDCLSQFFGGKGFAVTSAFSGEEALEQLFEHPVDVILLDILLPGLSGIEVLRRIKSLYPAAKVVMVSAFDQTDLRMQARHYGAADYVTKPFDFSAGTWQTILA